MAKNKGLTINVLPEEIVGSEIVKRGDYRYASVGIKKGDSEYLRVSYEWKGEGNIPEFVLGLMAFMTSSENKEIVDKAKETGAEEYKALKERM
jgi:hypothetical protein